MYDVRKNILQDIERRFPKVKENLGISDFKGNPKETFKELEQKNMVSGRRPETVVLMSMYLCLKKAGYQFLKKDFLKEASISDVAFRNNLRKLRDKELLVVVNNKYRDGVPKEGK